MSEFRVGELVNITIKGVRVINSYPTSRNYEDMGTVLVVSYDAADESRSVAVNLAATEVSVERVAPANWPPQAGDLWRDRDGGLWFAQDDGASDVTPPVMWMVPSAPRSGGDDGMQAARLFAGHSPLTLVYREPDGDQS